MAATARIYAESKSGLKPVWVRGTVRQQVYDRARQEWDKDDGYNHAAWFYDGPFGKWIGYKLAYRLGKQFFKDGFDLEQSLTVTADELQALLRPR